MATVLRCLPAQASSSRTALPAARFLGAAPLVVSRSTRVIRRAVEAKAEAKEVRGVGGRGPCLPDEEMPLDRIVGSKGTPHPAALPHAGNR